jgi:hypothetical protein
MAAAQVIPALDEAEDRHARLGLGQEFAAVEQFAPAEAAPEVDVKTLHAKIGELTLDSDFLSGALGKAGLLPSAKR